MVIAAGTLLSLLAAGSWSSVNLRPFAIYFGLAALASALKVRIPGMEGTISPNFVFLLLGMVALPFSQVAVISLAAALVQSLWASAKRPRLVQVAFSAAALVLSSSLAYKFAHLVLAGSSTDSAVVCVILAGSIYSPVNSGLVSMIIGLAEGRPLKQVCLRCYQWAFPYRLRRLGQRRLCSFHAMERSLGASARRGPCLPLFCQPDRPSGLRGHARLWLGRRGIRRGSFITSVTCCFVPSNWFLRS